jgi:hypothetical protein
MAVQRGIGALGIAGFVLSALLISWISGRFGQRVFDDEALTLAAIDQRSYLDLIRFYLAGLDVHPPLSFLWFKLLQDLQFPLWLQRVLSLAMASAGFALMLDLVWRRLPAERGLRILAVILFLGAPLLYGMGASLRWYPLLVLPLALAVWSALREERPTMVTAVTFGIAANVSFFAVIPAVAYVVWRYLIARQFDLRRDGVFMTVTAIVAFPAMVAFVNGVGHLQAQADSSSLVALGTVGLGLLGGYGLGLTHSLIAVPFALLALIGLIASLWRVRGDGLVAISVIVLLLCLVLTASGFAKPRSFLFAVPFLLAPIALGTARLSWRRGLAPAMAVASVTLVLPALWLLDASDRPFKRNLHIPDEEVLAVIRQHAPKDLALVITSEPGLGWRLRQEGYCVIAASLPGTCERQSPAVIVTIDDGTFTQRQGFSAHLGLISPQHRMVHQQIFGDDEDGPTKTFLTGRLVPKWLVSVAVYRRD